MIEFLKGFAFGTAVSILNYFLLLLALRKWEQLDSKKFKIRIAAGYMLRLALNFLTLFLVYKNPPMLLGAGFGLTVMKNVMIIKNIRRKG